ncbi:MAG: BON domain-containing protein [Chloroflexi bacterium]|nr:BON domain-containing protein [Chloroflexota bacterium]
MATVRDQEIAGAVQHAIDQLGRLHLGDRVQVRVENGVVQFLGIVCSAAERQALEETARRVPGVRQVVNVLAIAIDGERSDRDLRLAVEQALARWPDLRDGVDCRVQGGVVRLLGHIRHPAQEDLAIRVAGSVPGVEDVVSDLTISERVPATEQLPLDDATLVGRVADALAAAGVTIFEGRPQVDDGVATLAGKVGSWAERRQAGQAVAEVDGVRAVKNRLVVQKHLASADADEALAARVIRAFREDGRVSPSAVLVEAVGDIVFLSGVVNSPADQTAAEDVACRVPGVHRVVNDLLISGWQSTDRFVGRGPEEERFLS